MSKYDLFNTGMDEVQYDLNKLEELESFKKEALEVIAKLEKYVAYNGDTWVKDNASEFLRKWEEPEQESEPDFGKTHMATCKNEWCKCWQ